MNSCVMALGISSFFESLSDRIFSDGGYENLTENALFSVPMIVFAVVIGIAIAFVVTVFTKRVLGGLVRTLLAQEITSEDSAKTLDELGFGQNFLLKHAVKGNVSLRRVVYCREEDEFLREQEAQRKEGGHSKKVKEKAFRVNPSEHHFYIPAEQRDTAAVKFEKAGTSLVALWVWLAVLAVLLIILLFALPALMEWLDRLLGSFGSSAGENIV